MPSSFDPTNVGQIMVRTTPRLIDLLAALAAGLAGAFAIGRSQEGLESQLDGQIYGMRVRVTAIPAQILEFATR
jgi:hypothetical protein